jgi:anaerobic selenocysteine-containing dehydrogenase
MGWLNIIINEKLYDRGFVEKWTYGFDKLAERAQEYPPERVAQITEIPMEQIIESAWMYATTKPACIVRGLATDQFGRNSSRVEQARDCLRAITANLDVRGGDLIAGVGPKINGRSFIRETQLEALERLPEDIRLKQIGCDRFKLFGWLAYNMTSPRYRKQFGLQEPIVHRLAANPPLTWRAILTEKPYPVKAMITWDSNPMAWAGNTRLVYEALKSPKLDLHVVMEFWRTPTAELADYILPAASWMENSLCSTFEDMSDVVFGGGRSTKPLGERKDNYTIWRELAIRLGQEKDWPWKTFMDGYYSNRWIRFRG